MASLEGLKWTSILVLFGRTSCVSFGTSTRRPLNVPSGRPQVQYGRSIDVPWTSVGPLGVLKKYNESLRRLLMSWELMFIVKRERPFKCIAFQGILHLN